MKRVRADVFLVVVVALSGAVVAAYHLGRHSVQTERIAERVEESPEGTAEATEAAVVKRVSQQMEEIAYQQKDISDRQRARAEEQSQLALKMRDRAEQESRAAREAETMARDAAEEAEHQRANAMNHQHVAEQQRDEAELAKRVTDTLNYQTLARTLANTALTQQESGHAELACLLTCASWHYMDKYKGNTYQPELFSALSLCAGAQKGVQMPRGSSVQALCAFGEKGCVAVTDYGEVEWQKKPGERGTMLLQESSLHFRDVWSDDARIYALSLHGPLCILTQDGGCQQFKLPAGTYQRIVPVGESRILLAAQDFVCGFDCISGQVGTPIPLGRKLSAIVARGESLCLFFCDGTAARMDGDGGMSPLSLPVGSAVTAACYHRESETLYLGNEQGDILLVDKENRVETRLQGHISQVTSLTVAGDILVSAAFDKNVLVWDLSRRESHNLLPASLAYQAWPLAQCRMSDTQVVVGCSDGLVQSIGLSVKEMADEVKRNLRRDFTSEEWNQYVGEGISVETFR